MKVLTLILALSVLSACSTGMKKTTKNHKPLVGQFLGSVLKGDAETMRKLANSDYIQHNPYIPTGLEPFIKMLPVLKKAGTTA